MAFAVGMSQNWAQEEEESKSQMPLSLQVTTGGDFMFLLCKKNCGFLALQRECVIWSRVSVGIVLSSERLSPNLKSLWTGRKCHVIWIFFHYLLVALIISAVLAPWASCSYLAFCVTGTSYLSGLALCPELSLCVCFIYNCLLQLCLVWDTSPSFVLLQFFSFLKILSDFFAWSFWCLLFIDNYSFSEVF